MIASSVLDMLDKMSNAHPRVSRQFDQIKNSFKDAMWHIITDQLLTLVSDSEFDNGKDLIPFFNDFVKNLDKKINHLKYTRIAVSCSRQFENIGESIEFLEGIKERFKNTPSAKLYCQVSIAEKRLNLGDYNECLDILKEVESDLKAQNDVDQLVYSELYKTLAVYYRRKEKFSEFYQNGLQFLAYTSSEDLTDIEKREWCINMGKAILLGKDIYNIAELLEKDILKSLIDTDYEWLYEILQALNSGNVDTFEQALIQYHAQISQNDEIVKNKVQLQMKICILSLLDLIFHREKGDRNIDFELVAEVTKQPIEEVEFIIMKAMNLGLIKGIIDQVDQVVRITWVKPRMLPKDKLKFMSDKLGKWDEHIDTTIKMLENHCSELLQC